MNTFIIKDINGRIRRVVTVEDFTQAYADFLTMVAMEQLDYAQYLAQHYRACGVVGAQRSASGYNGKVWGYVLQQVS